MTDVDVFAKELENVGIWSGRSTILLIVIEKVFPFWQQVVKSCGQQYLISPLT